MIILFFLLLLSGVVTLGGASVGSYFENTLEEVREIEKKGLLKSPPASASFEAKDAIEFLGNSENIAKYVQSTLSLFKWCGVIFVGLVL